MKNRNRFIPRDQILVIYKSDLPNMSTHSSQSDCGYSVYKGVLVQWDEDQDTRVLDFIDNLKANDLENLAVIQEHEGIIAFLWKTYVPIEFQEDKEVEIAGDVWSITKSVLLVEPE